jgi:hypothetical protein
MNHKTLQQTLDVPADRAFQKFENKLLTAVEAGHQKLAATAAMMEVLAVDHLWAADEVDSLVDAIQSEDSGTISTRNNRVAAMRKQWKCWKLWGRKAKLKFPISKQPGWSVSEVVANWKTGLKELLLKPAISAAAEVKRLSTQFNSNGNSPDQLSIQLPEIQGQGTLMEEQSLECAQVDSKCKEHW